MVQALRNIGGGLVASLLLLATAFSNGALIFTGPLQPFLGEGVTAALITTAVTTIFVALTCNFPSAVAGPTGNTAALLAAAMVTLGPVLSAMPPPQALALVVACLGAAALLTGLALFALGWRRLGKMVRFVPYPVVAGFLAATGFLIVSGAVRMATGVPLTRSTLGSFAEPHTARLDPVSVLTRRDAHCRFLRNPVSVSSLDHLLGRKECLVDEAHIDVPAVVMAVGSR